MRTVFLVPAYDAHSGISTYCANMAGELIRRGREVLVVFWIDRSSPYCVKDKPLFAGMPTRWVEFDGLDKSAIVARILVPQLALRPGDTVISQGFAWASPVVRCVRHSAIDVKHLDVLHDDAEVFYRHGESAISTCDLYVTVSERISRQLACRVAEPSGVTAPILVCPGGVTVPEAYPRSASDLARFRFCYVGRLDPLHKRIYDLVPLLKDLVGAALDFEFTLFGGGGGDEEGLRERMHAAGVLDKVTFAGRRPNAEVLAALRENHAFVLPSAHEAFSVALCEAMAQGAVPVVTRVSGSEDVVRDGENGFLVEVGDTAGMAAALKTLATDRERWAAMSQRAWQTAWDELRIEVRVDALEAAVAGLAADAEFAEKRRLRSRRQPRRSLLDSPFIPNMLARAVRRAWRAYKGPPPDAGSQAKRGQSAKG